MNCLTHRPPPGFSFVSLFSSPPPRRVRVPRPLCPSPQDESHLGIRKPQRLALSALFCVSRRGFGVRVGVGVPLRRRSGVWWFALGPRRRRKKEGPRKVRVFALKVILFSLSLGYSSRPDERASTVFLTCKIQELTRSRVCYAALATTD